MSLKLILFASQSRAKVGWTLTQDSLESVNTFKNYKTIQWSYWLPSLASKTEIMYWGASETFAFIPLIWKSMFINWIFNREFKFIFHIMTYRFGGLSFFQSTCFPFHLNHISFPFPSIHVICPHDMFFKLRKNVLLIR